MNNLSELPNLNYKGNELSKLTLHLFLQIIGKIRLANMPRKNHWWYITEYIDTEGITTGPIHYNNGLDAFSITLNVHVHQIVITSSQGTKDSFAIEPGLTVAQFYNSLMVCLQNLGISTSIHDKPFDLGINKQFKEINEYHHYNNDYTKAFWQVMLWVSSVFKTFSGRFYGKTCPVHLYWHSLDLAVTRFSGKKAPPMTKDARLSDKDAYTHECISFGFWAGDEHVPEPAFYSYTSPAPEGLDRKPLVPAAAEWVLNNGSPLAILRYQELKQEKNPQKALLDFMESTYQAGASLAGWDIEHFEVPPLSEI